MLTCGTLLFLLNVCLFILSILCGYKLITALSLTFVIIFSYYNLEFKIVTLCAGYCTSLVSKIREQFEANCLNLSGHKSLSIFCSTPRMHANNSSGIFKSESIFSPIPKSDKYSRSNGLNTNQSPKLHNSTLRLGGLSRYSLSEDMGLSNTTMKPLDTSPHLRSRAAGVRTAQTVAGPLLGSTRHKIDSHLYTDVNSPGLTTRIVQYDEVNRDEKRTIEPRYKGVGQFPIVNLNRTPPRQIPLKRPCVKIRIAPPDASSYASDHRTHMLTTEQHRPLLPSPVQEPTGSPTRSVLEALKEISRKRIHSQDGTEYYTDEITKRQRKESLTRGAVGPNPFARPPISKRPREDEPRDYMESPLFSRHMTHENGYKAWRPKKRQRNETIKCNDILSSLSSSRHLQRENSKRKAEMSPKEDIKQVKLTVENIPQISTSTKDTDLKNTDMQMTSENKVVDRHSKFEMESSYNINQPKGTQKITLFNKSFPRVVNNSENSDDDGHDKHIKMPFVKPRQQPRNSSESLSYTEKCKLSQMLSCLSDTNSVDEFEISPSTMTTNLTSDANKINILDVTTTTAITESCVTPIVVPKIATITDSCTVSIMGNSITTTSKAPVTSIAIPSFVSSNNEASPNAGFSLINTTASISATTSSSKNTSLKLSAASSIFGQTSPIFKSIGNISVPNSTDKASVSTSGFNISPTNNFVTNSKAVETTVNPSTPSCAPLSFGFSTSLSTNAVSDKPDALRTTTSESSALKENDKGGFQFDLNKTTSNDTVVTKQNAIFATTQTNKPNTSEENVKNLNGPSFENVGNVMQSGLKSSTANNVSIFSTPTAQNSSIFGNTNATFFGGTTMKSSNENDSKLLPSTAPSNSFTLNPANSTDPTTTTPFVFGNSSTTFTSSSITQKPESSSSNITNNPIFGVPKTTVPSFGAQTAFNTTSSLPVFGSNKTNMPSDDTKQVTTTGTTLSSTFGVPINATSLFANSSAQSTTTMASGFTFATSSTVSKSLFPSTVKSSNSTTFGASTTATTTMNTPIANSNSSASTILTSGSLTAKPSIFGSSASNSALFGTGTSNQPVFGGPVTTSATPNSTTLLGTSNKSGTAFGSPTFSFGASVTTPSSIGATVTTTSSFGAAITAESAFGSSGPSTAPAFGATNTTSPTFGVPKTTASPFGAVSPTTLFGTNTIANLPAFQTNSTASAFGIVATNAPSTSNTTNTFGNNSTNLGAAGSTPAFGTKATFVTPSTTATIFGNTAQNTAFGASNLPADKSVFTFGSNTAQSSTAFNFGSQTSAPKTFSFNANTTGTGFGTNTITSNFGASAAAPSFGANAAAPSFGANTAAPSFGANAAAPSFGANPAAPSFGASVAVPTFGANAAAPSFGANAATSNFGANTATPSFGANAATPSFGANSTVPSFGANATVPSFGANATPASFGTSTQLNSSFGASALSGGFNSPSPAFGANPSGNMFSIGAGSSSKSRMRNRRQR